MPRLVSFFLASLVLIVPTYVLADETPDKIPSSTDRAQELADYLSNTKFVGKFTIDGKNIPPATEEYTISRCEKLPAEDMYRLTARIKYGSVDSEVPMEIKILFSGDTPVMTLDSLWIPGMGTFDARVIIRRGRYAGTWQHDQSGGHLFGKIVPVEAEPGGDESGEVQPAAQ